MADMKVAGTPTQTKRVHSSDIVYVRRVMRDDIESGIDMPDGVEEFYALHDETGRRLALFDDREFAFATAKQNDLTAMSVH